MMMITNVICLEFSSPTTIPATAPSVITQVLDEVPAVALRSSSIEQQQQQQVASQSLASRYKTINHMLIVSCGQEAAARESSASSHPSPSPNPAGKQNPMGWS